ncbi:DEAD/DEAH box helicase [Cryobacterium sp. M23]|uniref:DEAD/DEAH box helicase n=1 Tax=Cryobacterium sp. M23 TaxID=2048292 RepID=UPI000CE4D266|nr:DEAD/DEAH box helicase [Cryobacterium sp. M23]
MSTTRNWQSPTPALLAEVNEHRSAALDVYRRNPNLIQEHLNQEDSYRTGGYAERQLFELVQNAADANVRGSKPGRVELRLSGGNLYCANEGEAFTSSGLRAVTHAFLSGKRGDEIGRFGLGFKSVLSVTDNAQILSHTVSLEFNSPDARAALSALAPDQKQLPQLRVPTVLDPETVFADDAVAAELATWATTIIRLPNVDHADRLKTQLATFQTEFLLFASAVSTLRLVIDEGGEDDMDLEHTCVIVAPGRVEISAPDGSKTEWLINERMHEPSSRARAEVGEAVARKAVKITYAAPLQSLRALGQFWAYFPLRDETTARGLFNAPWRVNDDRTSLLPGLYNKEIYEQFAQMFVEVLPLLSSLDDPARHFDYMPGRGKEIRSDGDQYFTQRIPVLAAAADLVPDATGTLCSGSELRLLSLEYAMELGVMELWQTAPASPDEFAHFRCFSTADRRKRLENLVRNDSRADPEFRRELGFAEWLTVLSHGLDFQSLQIALRILHFQKDRTTRALGTEARIVPSASGKLFKANATFELYLRGESVGRISDLELVDPRFLALPKVEEILKALDFHNLTPSQEFRSLLRTVNEDWSDAQWEELWNVMDDVPNPEARQLLSMHQRDDGCMKLRAQDGSWRDSRSLMLATGTNFAPADPRFRLDTTFHGANVEVLKAMGVVCGVDARFPIRYEPLYQEYRAWANEKYQQRLSRDFSATTGEATFVEEEGPGPIQLLQRLHADGDTEAQADWSAALLRADADRTWSMMRVGDARATPMDFIAPHLWAIKKYGLVATTWGPIEARFALDPALIQYRDYLPVAQTGQATKLGLAKDLKDVPPPVWEKFLETVPQTVNPQNLGTLVLAAARRLPPSFPIGRVPAIVGAGVSLVDAADVQVATTGQEISFLLAKATPFLHIAEEDAAEYLVERLGALRASEQVAFSVVTEGVSEAALLWDRYRGFKRLPGGVLRDVQLVACDRIAKRVTAAGGVEDEPIMHYRQGSTIYYQRDVLADDLMVSINREFTLGLSVPELSNLLNVSIELDMKLLMEQCQLEDDEVHRLLMLFTSGELEAVLPVGLLKSVRKLGASTRPLDVSRLFLNVYGFDSLNVLKNEFIRKGFPCPDRWAGSLDALKFVRDLGFKPAYAQEKGAPLAASVQVLGRPGLPALHGYQVELANQIREVLRAKGGVETKAMLFLPTGAGKTRVTVEAVVQAFLEDGLVGPVLWIAQSEELCEQAVQTWSAVWRELADTRTLTIGRLWGSNTVSDFESDLSIIVATDAKLEKLVDKFEYKWLADATAVIVDEAHVAGDSSRYTRIFRWLGVDGRSADKPLLGLSATTFKNRSEGRTKSLVARFGHKRLNVLGDDPYGTLQGMGVLARVRYDELQGAEVRLSPQELEDAASWSRLSPTVMDRVGNDEDRAIRIVEHIKELDPKWPVLVFTSSVFSAQVLAALLQAQGISAASVSGKTRRQERRRVIQEFKDGKIRVLANCDVLTQGFDAPGVRALYIARPTLSPNAYIQMVGRGLRGPLNGGEAECLIVNLKDTFSNFSGNLDFTEFDGLWESTEAATK